MLAALYGRALVRFVGCCDGGLFCLRVPRALVVRDVIASLSWGFWLDCSGPFHCPSSNHPFVILLVLFVPCSSPICRRLPISIVLGVCDAVTPVGDPPRTPRHVTQRAEELVMRLCRLGSVTAVRVRRVLVSCHWPGHGCPLSSALENCWLIWFDWSRGYPPLVDGAHGNGDW